MTERVKKRCRRCHHVAKVPKLRRHCRQRRFGKGSWACWGDLERVVRPRKNPDAVEIPAGLGVGYVLSEEAEAVRVQQYRENAAKKRDAARKKAQEIAAQLARLSKRLRRCQQEEDRWAKRAAMSDAELFAAHAARKVRAANRQTAKPVRGIALGQD